MKINQKLTSMIYHSEIKKFNVKTIFFKIFICLFKKTFEEIK